MFSCEFCGISKNTFLTEHHWTTASTHFNINSTRNKLEFSSAHVKENIDLSMNSETKIDDSFLAGNFVVEDFSTIYQLDHDNGGCIILYVSEKNIFHLTSTREKHQVGFTKN